jgi:hypothetical protein
MLPRPLGLARKINDSDPIDPAIDPAIDPRIESDEWIENTHKFEDVFYSKFYYQRNEGNTA